jgi:hypothetical protein
MSIASYIVVIAFLVLLELFAIYEIYQQLCPKGGFHIWKYVDHYLELAHFTCTKCNGKEDHLVSQNKINWLESHKYG